MLPARLFPATDLGLPAVVKTAGYSLSTMFFLGFVWFNDLSVRSLTSVDFVLGLLTTGPFIGVILYSGYWLEKSSISCDRYSRIGKWFFGGLVGFLSLNVAMIFAWPADGTYNNIAWALFAAAVGGGMGSGIGIFEARAIDRAVTAERDRVKRTEMKQRKERLEEFTSIVSHDLRNPLSVASGRLALIRQQYDNEHIEAVASAHERMETIIERTLTLAQSGQIIGEMEPVEFKSLAQVSWDGVKTLDATLTVDNSAMILADPDRLRHLFENLFRNSLEHAGEDVHVQVGTIEDRFYVEDDGPGISDDEQDDVFDSGYSTSDDGIGFGLSIVEGVVEAHEWDIHVTEGMNGGARFEVGGVEFAEE